MCYEVFPPFQLSLYRISICYIFQKCLVEFINKAIKAILDLRVLDQGAQEFIDLEVFSKDKSLKTLPRTSEDVAKLLLR